MQKIVLVWDSIDLKKFDISKYGNGKDGTGLINFEHRFEICMID